MLYVVATPIGNLKDISKRTLNVLRGSHFVLSEKPKTTKKLLSHFKIKKKVIKYNQHFSAQKINELLNLLEENKKLALVSEAGTPAISDPGFRLIKECYKKGFKVIPIPGPCALVTAASISGFPMDKFLFLGFPPKKKRDKFFKKVASSKQPVILYESPHRIIKTLEELKAILGKRKIFVGRELTKKFESTYRGEIKSVIEEVKKDPIKGEYVIVINSG